MSARREDLRRGRLRDDRRAELDARGMIWDVLAHRWWNDWLPLLATYRATVGEGPIPALYRTPEPDDRPLGHWVHKQYAAARTGSVTAEQREALERHGLRLQQPAS